MRREGGKEKRGIWMIFDKLGCLSLQSPFIPIVTLPPSFLFASWYLYDYSDHLFDPGGGLLERLITSAWLSWEGLDHVQELFLEGLFLMNINARSVMKVFSTMSVYRVMIYWCWMPCLKDDFQSESDMESVWDGLETGGTVGAFAGNRMNTEQDFEAVWAVAGVYLSR